MDSREYRLLMLGIQRGVCDIRSCNLAGQLVCNLARRRMREKQVANRQGGGARSTCRLFVCCITITILIVISILLTILMVRILTCEAVVKPQLYSASPQSTD